MTYSSKVIDLYSELLVRSSYVHLAYGDTIISNVLDSYPEHLDYKSLFSTDFYIILNPRTLVKVLTY